MNIDVLQSGHAVYTYSDPSRLSVSTRPVSSDSNPLMKVTGLTATDMSWALHSVKVHIGFTIFNQWLIDNQDESSTDSDIIAPWGRKIVDFNHPIFRHSSSRSRRIYSSNFVSNILRHWASLRYSDELSCHNIGLRISERRQPTDRRQLSQQPTIALLKSYICADTRSKLYSVQ